MNSDSDRSDGSHSRETTIAATSSLAFCALVNQKKGIAYIAGRRHGSAQQNFQLHCQLQVKWNLEKMCVGGGAPSLVIARNTALDCFFAGSGHGNDHTNLPYLSSGCYKWSFI